MSMIQVNGKAHALVASFSTLLEELGLEKAVVATALNGDFIPAGQRDQIILKAGDQIEILAPMQGG
ncbi:sulfur carrier protein ThiS [Acetobacteraceae bacterium B3987]|nr:sulfur carrier protein ThiS [Acetobacteraceae bacterium B3987]